jgi:hypothetical protein
MHLVLVAAAGGGFSTRRRRHAACFSFISSRRFYWSIAWQFEGKTACPSVFMNRRPTRRQSARFKVLPRIGTVQTNQWNLKENGKKTFLRNKRGWIFMLARGRFKKKKLQFRTTWCTDSTVPDCHSSSAISRVGYCRNIYNLPGMHDPGVQYYRTSTGRDSETIDLTLPANQIRRHYQQLSLKDSYAFYQQKKHSRSQET